MRLKDSIYFKNKQTCRSKLRFSTEADAERDADRVLAKYGGERKHPYLCHICGKWHLTSQPQEDFKPLI